MNQKVTFVNLPCKVFGDLFNDSFTMDVRLYNYCFQNCQYAFHPSTRVFTRNSGKINIERLRDIVMPVPGIQESNTEFLSCDDMGNTQWVKSKGISVAPLGEKRYWLKIKMKGGREVIVTNDHTCHVWDRNGWKSKEADNLNIGDLIPFVHKINEKNTSKIPSIIGTDNDTSFLAGVILGDGYLGTKTRSSWVTVGINHTTKKWIGERLLELGCKEPNQYRETVWCIEVPSREEWQSFLGTDLSKAKKVPTEIFSATEENIKNFLIGLFSTDGHRNHEKRRWQFSSISPHLVEGAQFLLNRLGFYTKIWKQEARCHSSKCYSVVVSGEDYESFCKEVYGEESEITEHVSGKHGNQLRKTPNQLLDGCHGKWWGKKSPTGYRYQHTKYAYPSSFAETMSNSDVWAAPIIDIEIIKSEGPEQLAICPVNTPFKRIVTADGTVMAQCFANLNKVSMGSVVGNKEDSSDKYIRQCQKALGQGYNPLSMIETFIRNKYTTIFSNNVDPFFPPAEEKFGCAKKLLTFWQQEKMPIFIQTKEVFIPEIFDLLVEMKDQIVVYVTITTLDDALSRTYEKGCPDPTDRFNRIERLTEKGVHCVVGLNPYLPDWCPDIRKFFQRVKDCGAEGVCTQALHLSRKQNQVVPKSFKKWAIKANQYDNFEFHKEIMETVAKEVGIKITYGRRDGDDFVKGNCNGLKQFEGDAHWLHEDVSDFYNQNEEQPVVVTWEQAEKYYKRFDILNHVINTSEPLIMLARDNASFHAAKSALGRKTKLINVMRYMWNNPDEKRFFRNFLATDLYQMVTDDESDFIFDDNNDLIYVYDPELKSSKSFVKESDEMIDYEAPGDFNEGVSPWEYSQPKNKENKNEKSSGVASI